MVQWRRGPGASGRGDSWLLPVPARVPDLWPLEPETWDGDTLFGLIEVFHDLAVRPAADGTTTQRLWLHYDAFSIDTGGRCIGGASIACSTRPTSLG